MFAWIKQLFAGGNKAQTDSLKTYLIIGLGNPGPEYAGTRHNIGAEILDAWLEAEDMAYAPVRHGLLARFQAGDKLILLLRPTTYMNLSGQALAYWMQEANVPLERVLIVCDDLNLEFGQVRYRTKGGAGGHNGLKHIAQTLGHENYPRLRFGLGKDFPQGGQVNFVLGKFTKAEQAKLPALKAKALEKIKAFIKDELKESL